MVVVSRSARVSRRGFVALALFLVVGCGGSSHSASSSSSNSASTTSVVETSMAAPLPERSAEAEELGQRTRLAMSTVSAATGRLAVSGGPVRYQGPFSATLDDGRATAMSASLEIGQASGKDSMEMVWVGERMYVGGAGVLAQAEVTGPGVEWVDKTTEAKFDRSTEITAAGRGMIMAEAAIDVTAVGEETINGATATRYDLAVHPDLIGASIAGELRTWMEKDVAVKEPADGAIRIRLWIDENDRPIRLEESYDVGYWVVEIVTEIEEFDTDVLITAPDPATVD